MLRPGQAVALCVLALLVLGVVMVNSAGMTVDSNQSLTLQSMLTSRPTIYAALAMLALFACAMLPIRSLLPADLRTDNPIARPGEPDSPRSRVLSLSWFSELTREYLRMWPVWLATLALVAFVALVYVPGIERVKNGSHRWINLRLPGLESIQPSEIAKWGLVILVAGFGARYARRMKSFWLGFAPGLAAAGLVAGFIVIEDLGTGALLGLAACIVLLAAGGRLWQLLILLPLPLAGAVLAIVSNPYRLHRIESFMDPYLDPQGKGFHMIQSMVAVANGQVFGRGLGHGLQKFNYLPEDTTDFIFAIICEELGIAGAALVLFLFAGLLWGIWTITRRERIPMLKLIGLGVMATIGLQALINLAVVTGLGPTKGIALPFLSSGGTGWILTAAAIGLLIAMDRAQGFESLGAALAPCDEPEAPLNGAPGLAYDEPAPEVMPVPIPVYAEYKPAPPAERPRPPAIDTAPQLATTIAAEPTPISPQPAPVAPIAPGETGLLFASVEVPAESSATSAIPPHTSADYLDSAIRNPKSGIALIDSTITEPTQFTTTFDAAAPPATPEIIITDEVRAWPEQSARLGLT